MWVEVRRHVKGEIRISFFLETRRRAARLFERPSDGTYRRDLRFSLLRCTWVLFSGQENARSSRLGTVLLHREKRDPALV